MPIALGDGNNGIAFIVSVGAVWECIAFACSSPQTAEINIRKRGSTLMKWVYAGEGLSAVTIGIAAAITPKTRKAILAGGVFGIVSAHMFYMHAKQSGLQNPGAETEEY